MKFYNRERELSILSDIKDLSVSGGQMTVMVGRRRIGKTQLMLRSTESQPTLYFFVSRKAENLLCRDFTEEDDVINMLKAGYTPIWADFGTGKVRMK